MEIGSNSPLLPQIQTAEIPEALTGESRAAKKGKSSDDAAAEVAAFQALIAQAQTPSVTPSAPVSFAQDPGSLVQPGVERKNSAISTPSANGNVQASSSPAQALVTGNGNVGARSATKPEISALLNQIENPSDKQTQANLAGISANEKLNDSAQPWRKDWVFAPQDSQNPNLKALFDSPERRLNRQISSMNEMLNSLTPSQLQELGLGVSAQTATSKNSGDLTNAKGGQGDAQKAANATNAAQISMAQQRALGDVHQQSLNLPQSQLQSESALASMLNSYNDLNPEMENDSLPATTSAAVKGKAPNTNTKSKMSGADFLSTLEAVQPNPKSVSAKGQNFENNQLTDFAANNKAVGLQPVQQYSSNSPSSNRLGQLSAGDPQLLSQSSLALGANQQALGQLSSSADLSAASMTGHVVQGAMAKDRLSSESLIGMSTQIKNLTPNGGGEMSIRLKPDNLGDLKLQIFTKGNQVGLKVQASNPRSKQILEESIEFLKEKLQAQNLNLARVDFAISSPSATANSQFNQNNSDSMMNQQMQAQMDLNQGSQQQGGRFAEDLTTADQNARGTNRSGFPPNHSAAQAARAARAYSETGRLDVTA